MFKSILVATGIALASFGAAAVESNRIDGLYNTGAGLASGKIDTHYTFEAISGTAVGTNGHGVTTRQTGPGAMFNSWLDNTADSKWLAPTANARESYDPVAPGLYKWSISFDLTGLDISSAWITGRWAADNNGYIQLNGTTISSGSALDSWTSFSATAGFLYGVNTLDFFVINTAQKVGNATGVRVEFLDSYAIAAVPEPDSWALVIAGLAVVGAISRRRLR
jgi:hypothetical protein